MVAGELVHRLRETVSAWQDPVLRYERAVRRAQDVARRRTITAAGLTGAAAILVPYSGLGLLDVGWVAASAATTTSAVLAVRRAKHLRAQIPPARPPRLSSAARPGVDRLARAARALRGVLARLGSAAADTAHEAAAAERALGDVAGQVDAIETALTVAPAETHAGLLEGRAVLLARLDEGTLAYERLVAVAAECLAANASGHADAFARRRLDEATDRLRGLAAGWHEVHSIGRTAGT